MKLSCKNELSALRNERVKLEWSKYRKNRRMNDEWLFDNKQIQIQNT